MQSMNNWEVYSGAALVGAVAGMRSMAAPAVIGQLSRRGVFDDLGHSPAPNRRSRLVMASNVLAVAELIADKLPNTPNRIAAGPLFGRALSGSLSGGAVASSKGRSALVGAFIGAIAAVAVAYGAYNLRKQIARKTRLPDPLIALTEDAVVASLAAALTSRFSRPHPQAYSRESY